MKETTVTAELPALDTEGMALEMALLAQDAKGEQVAALRVLELVYYTDWFVICTARSERHARAIYDAIWDSFNHKGIKPLSSEGLEAAQWIVADYGSVVLHIFYEPVRNFYGLERLWADAPRLEIPTAAPTEVTAKAN